MERKIAQGWISTVLDCQESWCVPLNPPVSASLTSLAFQTRQLSNFDVRLFKMTSGNSGSYLFRMHCDGHDSYPGPMRKDNIRASVVWNAGPNKESLHTYYCQGMNVCFILCVWCTLNDLIQLTYPRTRMFYKHLFCTSTIPKSKHGWVCKQVLYCWFLQWSPYRL